MWTASETAGARTLYRVYLALLDGVAPPESFNKSLAVYIPQELDETVPGLPSALFGKVRRPITLSNIAHKLLAQTLNQRSIGLLS